MGNCSVLPATGNDLIVVLVAIGLVCVGTGVLLWRSSARVVVPVAVLAVVAALLAPSPTSAASDCPSPTTTLALPAPVATSASATTTSTAAPDTTGTTSTSTSSTSTSTSTTSTSTSTTSTSTSTSTTTPPSPAPVANDDGPGWWYADGPHAINIYDNDDFSGVPVLSGRFLVAPTCSWISVDFATGVASSTGQPGMLNEPGCSFTYEVTTAGGSASATWSNSTMFNNPAP